MSETWTALIVALSVLAVLIALRAPIALALFGAGGVGILMTSSVSALTGALSRMPYDSTARYVLIIVPLFIAMGVFARHGSLAESGFYFARRWLAWMPGGLPIAVVCACAIFAAVSGSSVATVAALGPITVREMTKAGYDRRFAAGVVGAAGTLGILIPPSIVLVMFGIVAGVSVGDLFIAGIIPGFVTVVVFSVAIWLRAMRRTVFVAQRELVPVGSGGSSAADIPPIPPGDLEEGRVAPEADSVGNPTPSIGALLKVLSLFLVVVGGLYAGFFTITEAAAFGAGLALLYFLMERRAGDSSRWSVVRQGFAETVNLNAMIFFLLMGAGVFSYFLVSSGVPRELVKMTAEAGLSPTVLVVMILALCIILGMFLDSLSIILIVTPLVLPLLQAGDVNLIWFGILFVKAIEVGLITPPLGLNAFVVAGAVPGLTVRDAFHGVLRFVPLDLIVIFLLFVMPWLVTSLPERMGS